MKKLIFLTLSLCAVCLFDCKGNAQQTTAAKAVLSGTGKAAVIIVGTAGKVGYKTAKFAGKHIAGPAAKSVVKPLVTRLAPRAAKFSLRLAGKAAKQTFKSSGKLGFAYLKTKLP